jgi:anti-anti-sigma factor
MNAALSERWSSVFAADTAAVRQARRFVAASPAVSGLDPGLLEIAVSEIVTNAVLHARTDFVVTLVPLEYRLPPAAADASRRLGELLDEVDDYCRARGHLLTLVPPDDAVAYRHWFLGEFIGQIGGAEPVPWPQHREQTRRPSDAIAAPTGEPTSIPPTDWNVTWKEQDVVVAVTGSLDLASAPALRQLLVTLTSTATSVTVDLSPCQFIDSVGVSVLNATLLRARETGIALRFRLGEVAARVLRISGVLDHLDVEEP